MAGPILYGREREIGVVDELFDRVHEQGAALVVRGEPGIGKSTLLSEAGRRAAARGLRVLTAEGVEAEAHLPFAGLHQLLRPILAGLDDLPAPQREAVQAAFGMNNAAAPELFLIALATLGLLADAAARAPLVLLVEDVHWLDRPSADVLGFVARRLGSDPIVLLATVRDGFPSALDQIELTELRLGPLDDVAAEVLLDKNAPELPPTARARVLVDAAGNPLALAELPTALRSEQLLTGALLPDLLPLTQRLERAFAVRVAELPAASRILLLVAALDAGGALAEVLSAAARVIGMDATDALEAAVAARLVEVGGSRLRFRHPLVRSAIHQAASLAERRAVHAALAEELADQPDLSVWHRAAATLGPDEHLAAELEAVAQRAQQRGGIVVAIAALERAAQLTEERTRQGGILVHAAELALELGRRDVVARLLREVEPLELGVIERGRIVLIREMMDRGFARDTGGVGFLVDVAERVRAGGDTDLALNLLRVVAEKCWWTDPGAAERIRVVAAAERMVSDSSDYRLLAVLAHAAPIERGRDVVDWLSRVRQARDDDPETMRLLGTAAIVVGAFDLAGGFLVAAAEGLRAQGRLGHLAPILYQRAWLAVYLADWNAAIPLADEARRLELDTGEPLWTAGAQVVQTMLAALRGERDVADALANEAERLCQPIGASVVLALIQLGRGLAALGDGRHEEAYAHLRRVFDPADPAYHDVVRCWAIRDLAEAAVHSGHRAEARTLLEELERLGEQTPASGLHVGLRYARPVLAEGANAEALFRAGLAADLSRWPVDRARLLLAYGTWLRRRRRVADARAPLRAAREAFDAFGLVPWGERARQELRASGEVSRRPPSKARDQLTPQELQIAQLAAAGLSNREIGQKLYLSPRTVGAHLYRVFPKLGITTRAGLRDALRG